MSWRSQAFRGLFYQILALALIATAIDVDSASRLGLASAILSELSCPADGREIYYREMRRAIMNGFGNAKLDGRDEVRESGRDAIRLVEASTKNP